MGGNGFLRSSIKVLVIWKNSPQDLGQRDPEIYSFHFHTKGDRGTVKNLVTHETL